MALNQYNNRKYVIAGIIVLLISVFIVKLFVLQVIENRYKLSASSNVLRRVTQYPVRGLIYDRNNTLLVFNEAAYDLMAIPRQIEPFDTVDLCKTLDITTDYLKTQIKIAKRYSWYKPSVILKQISAETYGVLQEKMYKFHGFFVQTRTLRKYPRNIASNVLGFVGEVNDKDIKSDNYYKSGDYIGKSGIESSYEKTLRGEKGEKIFLVDVHNRIMGSFKDGKDDRKAIGGKSVKLSLDADLQDYGELLMNNKIGSIVALDPQNGEILAMVSSPTYSSSLLSGRVRTKNYHILQLDTLKPLFNRCLLAQYPPGSTFKPLNALIGLQEGVVFTNTKYPCHHGYHIGSLTVGCHGHKSPLDLIESIQHSCNSYYCYEYRTILDNASQAGIEANYNNWRKIVLSFGYGRRLGIDFPYEIKGNVPSSSFYRKLYGKAWNSLNIISLAIGQGEILVTPLQMANFVSIIANRGYYKIPHFVKEISGKSDIKPQYTVKHYVDVDSGYFAPVIQGMYLAVHGGPGSTARIANVDSLEICGKTGTAQNPHGEDHSIFIAFAPRNNPKIAVSVYVENGGYGSTWAAPIASLIIEKYLKGTISRKWLETRVKNGNLLNRGKKE